MAATGLPGRPKNRLLPRVPKVSGRPGLMASFQNATAPSSASISLMKSASPTETPPEVRMASLTAAASERACRNCSRSSGIRPRSMISMSEPASSALSV